MSQYAELALSLLREIPFIKESAVPDKALKEFVEDPLKQNRLVAVNAGDACISEGEFGDTFYVVLNGTLGIEIFTDDGTMLEVAQVSRGSFFGELAMIGKGHRTATVRAKEGGAELLEISKGAFDNLVKRQKKVKAALQSLYEKRTLSKFVKDNWMLEKIGDADKQLIVDNGKLHVLEPMKPVYKKGEAPKSFYLIKQGYLKIWREDGDAESILAFVKDNDFFGDLELVTGQPRAANVTTMERVEIVEVPRSVFAQLFQRYPEIIKGFRKYELDRKAEIETGAASKTGIMFKADLIQLGMAQARSALVINTNICTRCANCVQSCHDLHGHSRLIRRGKTLRRREKSSLESMFFPNSCIHCRVPSCMFPCPTGAISRDREGETWVKEDLCIGCGQCATACEFGNITIRGLSESEAAKATAREKGKAVKCDICKHYDHPNCVYNCPQAAILRIDPNSYFDELSGKGVDLVGLAQGAPPGE
jgi:CRP-like cAMP-binding protein/ferredoxin-like protein FixX